MHRNSCKAAASAIASSFGIMGICFVNQPVLAHFRGGTFAGRSYAYAGTGQIVESQIGPVVVEMQGSAGGLPDAELRRLVVTGVKYGCSSEVSRHIRRAAGPPFVMIWDVVRSGAVHPMVTLSAHLLRGGRQIGFAFTQSISPGAAPPVVFESAVAGVTCAVFMKAGYLTEHRQRPPPR